MLCPDWFKFAIASLKLSSSDINVSGVGFKTLHMSTSTLNSAQESTGKQGGGGGGWET